MDREWCREVEKREFVNEEKVFVWRVSANIS
jgi:hypothetical protein